ncbi:MAG: peptidoglycan DD-metalloendopeptidase family protein [Gemmatimonadota bacterium]|nr:peptidoglycan DD-metalloendopeptidase family protein [Gemmatimonadota bacterium]MDH5759207.1 peptidoglycan DD-metalloendopeptidase family protein [Gemmatimonadota bacterium]
MIGDNWTFLVLRDGDGSVSQYTVSKRILRYAVAGVAGTVLVLGGLAVALGVDGTARVKAMQLQAQNEALREELAQFQGRIGSLESTLGKLAEQDTRYRNLAGLESIDPEVMQVGVGGPGLGTPESYPLWELDTEASQTAFALSYDLNALERRARLLGESLEEATDSLQQKNELMAATPSIMPTKGFMSSRFSQSRMHPIHNRPLPHPGVDIGANKGTPIYAAADGRVIRAEWVAGFGLTVEIDHGFGYTTLYGHASKLIAQRGQRVSRGDLIAQVGSTGISTGDHLHYEVRRNGRAENPANYILPTSIP